MGMLMMVMMMAMMMMVMTMMMVMVMVMTTTGGDRVCHGVSWCVIHQAIETIEFVLAGHTMTNHDIP